MTAPSPTPQDLPEEIAKAIEALRDAEHRHGGSYFSDSSNEARLERLAEQACEALTAAILSRLTNGAPASPSGSQASPEAPSDPRPSGVDPSRIQWQPIATAPKDDETSILVCDARVLGGFHQVVWWDPDSKAPGWHWDTSDGPTFHQDAFTHWMPLPAPPALSEAPSQGEQ